MLLLPSLPAGGCRSLSYENTRRAETAPHASAVGLVVVGPQEQVSHQSKPEGYNMACVCVYLESSLPLHVLILSEDTRVESPGKSQPSSPGERDHPPER